MIVQKVGKITQHRLLELCENSDVLTNVLDLTNDFVRSRQYWHSVLKSSFWSPLKKETVDSWGKSNIEMRHYESAPGVWIFEDQKSGVIWFVWTDLHHKHPWKGSSFELKVPPGIGDAEMLDSLERFVLLLHGNNTRGE